MSSRPDPILPADPAAIATARALWSTSATAVLAYSDPTTGTPFVSRIGFGLAPNGTGLTLVSDLSQHTAALRLAPDAALLLGEVGPKGDPLNSPRLSVRVRAGFVPADAAVRSELRACWLRGHPKARVYVDFPDFHFVSLVPSDAFLNGEFGRAYALTGAHLTGMPSASPNP